MAAKAVAEEAAEETEDKAVSMTAGSAWYHHRFVHVGERAIETSIEHMQILHSIFAHHYFTRHLHQPHSASNSFILKPV